jgi:hypothetical protein
MPAPTLAIGTEVGRLGQEGKIVQGLSSHFSPGAAVHFDAAAEGDKGPDPSFAVRHVEVEVVMHCVAQSAEPAPGCHRTSAVVRLAGSRTGFLLPNVVRVVCQPGARGDPGANLRGPGDRRIGDISRGVESAAGAAAEFPFLGITGRGRDKQGCRDQKNFVPS